MDTIIPAAPIETAPAISPRIAALAEAIARELRTPGIYQITIRVPEHRRAPWPVVVERVETLRLLAMARDDGGG